jgi:hypothetical protein
MPRSEPRSFDLCRDEVEEMLSVGRPLGAIERMLQQAPLSADERSALWLLAWSLADGFELSEPVELKLVPDDGASS